MQVTTIPLLHFCSEGGSSCGKLGFLAEDFLFIEKFSKKLDDLKLKNISTVRIPCAALDRLDFLPYLEAIQKRGLRCELMLHLSQPMELVRELLAKLGSQGIDNEFLKLLFLFPEIPAGPILDICVAIEKLDVSTAYVLVARHGANPISYVRRLPQFVSKKLFFIFPVKCAEGDGFYSADEIFAHLQGFRSKLNSFSPKALPYTYGYLSVDERSFLAKDILFRELLSIPYYESNHVDLGKSPWLRAASVILTKSRWFWPLRPFWLSFVGLLWWVVDPQRAWTSTYWYVQRSTKDLAWNCYSWLRRLDGLLAAGRVELFWILQRIRNCFHRLGISSYWYTWKQGSKLYSGLHITFWTVHKALSWIFWRGVWPILSFVFESMIHFYWQVLWRGCSHLIWNVVWPVLSRAYERTQSFYWNIVWHHCSRVYELGLSFYWRIRWKLISEAHERAIEFFWGPIWRILYPIRKCFYFLEYQFRRRFLRE